MGNGGPGRRIMIRRQSVLTVSHTSVLVFCVTALGCHWESLHVGCTRICSQTACHRPTFQRTGALPSSEHFSLLTISINQYQMALPGLPFHLTHFLWLVFFSLRRLIFNKNFVLSFLLCPLLGRHLAKHMDAYYKGPAGSWSWGDPFFLEPR